MNYITNPIYTPTQYPSLNPCEHQCKTNQEAVSFFMYPSCSSIHLAHSSCFEKHKHSPCLICYPQLPITPPKNLSLYKKRVIGIFILIALAACIVIISVMLSANKK